mmetsp:Transcript_38430/g.44283  ORF Transcript_38430/g.44283 Transcript_38430/m.44283 type:complete len:89 (+) Transcript_38430:379-645(+)
MPGQVPTNILLVRMVRMTSRYPFFPFLQYLSAKDSSSKRTYSSELFARVCATGTAPAQIAKAAKTWTDATIQKYRLHPEKSGCCQFGW